MMAVTILKAYAKAVLQVFDESSMKTDAGAQAVMTYLLVYPGQSIEDLAGIMGFDEARVRDYLSALGDLAEQTGTAWHPSARGRSEIERVLATAGGSRTSSGAAAAAGLSATEAKRWEEVKRIVMDTSPGALYLGTLRAQYEHYFSFVDGNAPMTLEEAAFPGLSSRPGEAHAQYTFAVQGQVGLTVHRPGTQPAVDFGALIKTFQQSPLDRLLDSDGTLIQKALGLGHTFW